MKKILFLSLILTLLVGCSSKDKTYIERRDDCADLLARVITPDEFVKKYKIAQKDERPNITKSRREGMALFCQFYIEHNLLNR